MPVLWGLWLMVAAWPAQAASDALQALARLQGLSCRFVQTIVHEDGTKTKASGTLELRRGGMFRFAYEKPYEQLYISDGKTIWHYEPDLMQAERLSRLEVADLGALRILAGKSLQKEVELLAEQQTQGRRWLKLRLRATGRVVWLALDRQGHPVALRSRDALGAENRMELLHCRFVPPPRHRFAFRPPPGVDLIDQGGVR